MIYAGPKSLRGKSYLSALGGNIFSLCGADEMQKEKCRLEMQKIDRNGKRRNRLMQSARFIALTTDQNKNCVGMQKFLIAGLILTFFVIRGHAAEKYLAAFQPLTLHIHINQQKV